MLDNEFLLQDRLQKIRQVINKYGVENFYISFSGGKDSVVVSALVDMAMPGNKIPRVYVNTGIELKMIKNFVYQLTKNDNRFIMLTQKTSIKDILTSHGYPFKSKEHSHIVELYDKHGIEESTTVQKYLNLREGYGYRHRCPKILEYQFTSGCGIKISDKCCRFLKEKPLDEWAKKNHKTCRILGLRRAEGGRRSTTKCIAFKNNGRIVSFHPLSVVTDDWEEWFIATHNIEICDIYKDPYNFTRTGCKGCPFNIDLQKELDILEKFFPNEKKQCEIIWKPVYDEYRRLGYRLKKD